MAKATLKPSGVSNARGIGCLGLIAFFIIAAIVTSLLADFIGKRLKPERYAQVYGCHESGDISYTNTCDFDVNVRYCLYLSGEGTQTFCRTNRLKPGEGVTTLMTDRAAQEREIWSTAYWSGRPPLQPDMIHNLHNSNILERGCRRPQENPSDGQ